MRSLIYIIPIIVCFGLSNALAGDPGIQDLYNSIEGEKPTFQAFEKAMQGFYAIQSKNDLNADKSFLTLVDFTLPSSEKRLWVIDIKTKKTLYFTYVAHGRNSGNKFATDFSNQIYSNQSSLGFFLTGETYFGRNGFSLRLEGLEEGINDNARKRAIVMHGAWYASEEMIQKTGRLGRSFGCPAVPLEVHKELIKDISDRTIIFIYKTDPQYLADSSFF